MAKYLNISKYKEEDNIIYYYVEGQYKSKFYIKIVPKHKLVFFYKDNNFNQQPLGVIDFKKTCPFQPISGLNENDVAMASMRAGIALHKNEFPDFIGAYS